MVRTVALSNTRCSEDIHFPHRQDMVDEEDEVDQLVRARDVKDGAVFPLVWENAEVMAYVRQGSRFLDAKKFG